MLMNGTLMKILVARNGTTSFHLSVNQLMQYMPLTTAIQGRVYANAAVSCSLGAERYWGRFAAGATWK
jgi:hypothetical protein